MEKCQMIWLVAAVVLAYILYTQFYKKEKFALPANIANGLYLITNNGKIFTSTAFTTVECNNFQFQKPAPSMEDSWVVKVVAPGVAMLQKPNEKECLFTAQDGLLKSYLVSDCDRKNLCGDDELDAGGELDRYSIRSYFKLVNGPDGNIIIQSMQNNKYVCLDNGVAGFKTQPDESCYFNFQKI